MGEAEPRALQDCEVDRLRLPYRPLLGGAGFCDPALTKLEAVARFCLRCASAPDARLPNARRRPLIGRPVP